MDNISFNQLFNYQPTTNSLSSTVVRWSLNFLLFVASILVGRAEGIKQVAPASTDVVLLMTNNTSYGNFAAYNSTADNRLQINITNPSSEQVHFGFSQMSDGSGVLTTTTYYFRIKDPSGNIVYGPQAINNTNANANTWALANAGPSTVVGASGYTPFTYTPAPGAPAGDYYIEFSNSASATSTAAVYVKYWDITVATRTAPTAINGRVWSKRWALATPSVSGGSDPTYGSYDRQFNGSVHTYTNDGFVNKIDFLNSGFRGLFFNLAFNDTGTGSTGVVSTDRKSASGNATITKYKTFLNNPDPSVYPSGSVGSISNSPFVMNCPSSSTPCIAYSTTLPGLVQVLLDFNSTSGAGKYDPGTADVLLYETVTPVGAEVAPYKRCLSWNGKNGLGATVSSSAAVPIYLTYLQGTVHFPMYDVEYNPTGYTVTSVRPTPSPGHTIKFRYDDSGISAASGSGEATSNVVDGLTMPSHKWTNYNFGNANTINTWWYGNHVDLNSSVVPETPSCTFTGPAAVCASATGNTYVGPAGQDTYAWSITGSGTISGASNGQTVTVNAGASGSYTLTLVTTRSTCSLTCNQTVTVGLTAAITGTSTTCATSTGLVFSGSAGMSSYAWTISGNGTIVGATNAQNVSVNAGASGSFTLNLTVTGNGGACSASTSKVVTVTGTCAVNKYLYLTDPSQALDRTDPVATNDLTTASTVALSNAAAAVTLDATSSTSSKTGSSITISHTTGTGANRLMLVGISQKNVSVSSVTYGGVALTLVGEQIGNTNAKIHIYKLLNPASGTANVVVNFSGTINKGATVGVMTFSGVNQTTPLGTFASAQAKNSTPTVNVASATGELVFDVVALRNTSSLSVGSGQTQRWNINTTTETWGGGSTESGAATTTMSWTASGSVDWAIGGVSIKPATSVSIATFTESPVLCSALTIPSGSVLTVQNYVTVTSGTMPASPSITATLKYGATTIATQATASYNSTTGLLTWTMPALGSAVTVPAGQAIALQVTTAQSGVSFTIDYDSKTKPSKITIPTSTFINISNLSVYSAAYPGGVVVTNAATGGNSYVRVTVNDPFGATDISSVNLTITDPSSGLTTATLGNPEIVTSTTCGSIYQYKITGHTALGTWNIQAVANEGTEGVTASASTGLNVVTTVTPVLQTKQLYLSDPSQSLDRVDPVTTSDATVASTATLSSSGTTTTSFTQGTAMCSPLTVKGGDVVSVTAYVSIVSGSMPATPSISATLKYGTTTIVTLGVPTYTSLTASTGTLVWTGTVPAGGVIIPAGQAVVLSVTTAQAGVTFQIQYDATTKPSKISLPTETYIDISSFAFYNAAYPGGTLVTNSNSPTTVYARAVVTDPFGFSDITALNLLITAPGGGTSNVSATSVATSGCTRTYEYAWTPPSVGDYNFTATAKEGTENTVTDVTTAAISICPITVSATATTQPTCTDPTSGVINYTVTGGSGPYTYNWSNGSTTGTGLGTTISGLSAGTYNITVTSSGGCTGTTSVVIATPQAPTLSRTSTNISCNGGADGSIDLTASGGAAPYMYYWQDGNTNEDRAGLFANTWSVTVTGDNGCQATTSAILTEPTIINVTASTTNVNCNGGSTGTITLTVSGGSGSGYTYVWEDASTGQNRTALTTGVYNVTVTDGNSCTISPDPYEITQPDALSATTSLTPISCSSSTGSVNVSVLGGTLPYRYDWADVAGTSNTKDRIGLTAGTYNLTITDANNCSTTASAVFTSVVCNQPPVAVNDNVSTSRNVTKTGTVATNDSDPDNTAAQLTWTATTSVPPSQGVFSMSANGSYSFVPATNFTGTVLVNYQVCDIAPLCATSQLTIEVSIPVQDTICISNTADVFSVTPDPDVTNYTWTVPTGAVIVSGQGSPSIVINWSGATAGYDSICVSTTNICGTSANICRFIYKKQIAPIITTNSPCVGGNLQLGVAGGASYSWSGPSGFTSSLQNPIIYNTTTANNGTYSVTVTDVNGCVGIGSLVVTLKTPPSVSGVSTNTTCNGGTTGAIDLTVSSGTAPFTYAWSNATNTQDISGLSAGAYTVTVTSADGCVTTTTFPINESSSMSLSTAITNVACSGQSNGAINLTVSSGTSPYSYSWSNGATTEDISSLAAGSYSVTVTDAALCNSIATVSITQPSPLSANGTITQVACNGGSTGAITMQVIGGTSPYTFNWGGGITTQNRTGLAIGTYTVTVTDANNCTTTYSTIITQPTVLSLSTATTAVQCNGTATGVINLTVSGGTSPYTYSWTGGATTEDINNLTAGSYTVTVTDARGCSAITSATITQPSAITLSNVITNPSCNGNTNGAINLTATGGTTPFTYAWSNSANTEDLAGISAGIYTVTVTDAYACSATASITVTEPTVLTATATPTSAACNGTVTGSISVSATGGTIAYTYLWSSSQTTQNLTNIAAGNYRVTITDANSCTAVAQTTVTEPAAIALTGSVTNVSCSGGTTGAINLTATGGAGSLTFDWGGGITSEDRTGLAVGNYTVTVTDGNSCTATRTFTISQPTALSLLAAATNITCNGAANGSINLTVSNGVAPYTFLWSNSATTEDIAGLGTGSFTVTVTDANGCTETASAAITQPTSLITTPSVSNVSCFGGNNGSISTTTTGGTTPYTYAWSNGNSTANISTLTAGSYTLTVTDANGCATTSTSSVTQPTGTVDIVGSVVSVSCFGGSDGSISLTVAGGVAPYTYSWSNSAITQNINTLLAGSYTVTVTDNNLCTSIKTFTVTQPIGALALTTVKTDVSCTGNADGSINLSVSGGTSPYTYSWSTGETVQDISSLDVGTYSVTVTDAKNCTATTSVNITQPTLIMLSSTVTDASCGGGSDGAINLTVSGGVSPYTYTWSNGSVTEDISGITAGNYNVTVSGANSCSSTLTNIAISEASTIAVTPTVINNNCVNGNQGAINLTVSGGTAPLSYSWSNGATTKDISGLTAGTYTVVVKDAVNCVKFYGFTITQPSGTPIVLSTTITPSNCTVAAGAIDLTVSGGLTPYTYAWSNSATSQDLSNISAGTYTVTVTDANGCNQISTNLVNDNASPTLTSTVTNVQCNGSTDGSISLNVSGGVSPYSYTWSNGAPSASLTGVGIGTYSVSVVDANGCGTIATNSITEPTALQLSTAKNNPTCAGSDGESFATVSGGTTPYTYSWSNSATTSSISGLSAATYAVTVTDAQNCTVNGSIVLPAAACAAPIALNDTFNTTVNTPITQTVVTNDSDPDGLSTDLIYSLLTNPTPAQGVISFDPYGAFTFTTTTGYTGGFNLTYQVCDLTNICATAILRIVVTNATNTPTADSDTQTTLENTPVNIAVIANDNFGSDGSSSSAITITDNANYGTASVNSNGTPNDPTDDSIDYTPNTNYYGQDTIIYRICDATGDCDTAIVVLTVTPAPSVGGTTSYPGGVLCSSTNSGIITLSGHTGNVVKWQTSTDGGTTWSDIVNTTTSHTFTNAVNNQQYRAVVNNCPACLDAFSSVTTITVDLPTITGLSSSNPTLASCPALNDGSITVTASGSNLQYSKDNGATWQASNVFSGLTAGSYTIKIRNSVTTCEYTYTSNPVVLSAPTCFEICNDGIDNDGNGLTDCEDTAVCKPVAPALFKRD